MGYSVSWCAVPEQHGDSFIAELGLAVTGETEDIPESEYCQVALATGWRLLWVNQYASRLLSGDRLQQLSSNYDILLCLVEEHVMASSSELWHEGKMAWRIAHEGDQGPKGLEVSGAPPASLSSVRSEMEQLQVSSGGDDADVDYIFEIPLKVAKGLVGFKHDEECEVLANDQFSVLSQTAAKKGLLRGLFK